MTFRFISLRNPLQESSNNVLTYSSIRGVQTLAILFIYFFFILSVDAARDGYKLVIAPALLMLNENRAAALKSFVENGGHLVLTLRSGMKDDYNALLPLRQPGMLAEIAGVEVEEYYALFESVPVVGDNFRGESRIWAERL